MEKWQQELILEQTTANPSERIEVSVIHEVDNTALTKAKQKACRTKVLLSTRGWCLWKCSTLNNEIIVLLRDELVTEYPEEYPAYTDFELRELCNGGITEETLRIVHKAKKLAGATVISVEDSS